MNFLHLFYEKRREVKIARASSFRRDIFVHASYLFRCQPGYGGSRLRRDAVIIRIQAQIQFLVRQSEIEFLLRLRQGIGIGIRRAG